MKKKKLIIFVVAIVFIILGGFIFNQQAKSKITKENITLANKYLEEGKYEEAELALLKAISVEPKNVEARIQLAKAYTAEKKYDKAEQTLKDAAAIDVNDPAPKEELAKLYILQGKELLSAGKLNDAKGIFDKAVEVDKKRVKTYSEIADYYETTAGKVSEAVVILTRGYEETKDSGLKSRLDGMKEKITGNTNGNLVNGGLVAQQGDWIYFRNYSEGYKLYKIKIDGTEKTKLSDDNSKYINAVGDWIYYRNVSDESAIYKIKTDGTGRTKLVDDNGYNMDMIVKGDWIYYFNNQFQTNGSSATIYKVKTDGTAKTIIDKCNYISSINIVNDYIYYNSDGIYKIKTDGSDKYKVSNAESQFMVVDNNYIYYLTEAAELGFGEFQIWKIDLNDGNSKPIFKYRSFSTEMVNPNFLNVDGNWIYFQTDNNSQPNLCKINNVGTEFTYLSGSTRGEINITSEGIYCEKVMEVPGNNSNVQFEYYKIKKDGINKEIIYSYVSSD